MVSRVSSLSLVLPVSAVSSSSLSFLFLSLFLYIYLSLSFSHPSSLHTSSPLLFLSYSALATLLFRDLVSAAAHLFFFASDLYARPSLRQPRPCFVLYARAFPASPALRSDPLRIQREIDRPKRVPERPERTRRECSGKGVI